MGTLRALALVILGALGACRGAAAPASGPPDVSPPAGSAPPVATAAAPPPRVRVIPPRPERPLGIGLGNLAEYSPQLPFLNLVKQARPWTIHREGARWGEGGKVELDPQGWIVRMERDQSAELLLAIEQPELPFRRFAVRWKGQGRLRYHGNAQRIGDAIDGWFDQVELLDPPDGKHFFSIILMDTDPQDHLRDIEVVPEEFLAAYTQGERFNPLWLDKLVPFSTLRFMDWMKTNRGEQSTWDRRPKPEDLTWAYKGVPVEVMVALANRLQADPWFNLPHRADDAYARQLAEVVRAQLDPKLVAYFEYSNEVWNWGFPQAQYANGAGRYLWRDKGAAAKALAELETGPPKPDLEKLDRYRVPYDLAAVKQDVVDAGRAKALARAVKRHGEAPVLQHVLTRMLEAAPGDAYNQYAGMRAAQLCDVVKGEVFKAAPERVRCVVATHTAGRGRERALFECPRWSGAPCLKHGLDTYAITAYLGADLGNPPNAEQLRAWAKEGPEGVKKALAELDTTTRSKARPVDLVQIRADTEYHAQVAAQRGLQLVAYEGGQHVVVHDGALRKDPDIQRLLLAMNRDPGMGALYERLLDTWKAQGGTLFVHYVDITAFGQYGSWGALESLTRDNPKYEALVGWSAAHPRWWTAAAPGGSGR
jgi:hypothetical protein